MVRNVCVAFVDKKYLMAWVLYQPQLIETEINLEIIFAIIIFTTNLFDQKQSSYEHANNFI